MNNFEKNEKFQKLSKELGEEQTKLVLQIIDSSMGDFKTYMDSKFDHLENNINLVNEKYKLLIWMMGAGFTLFGVLMTILKVLG